MGGSFANIIFCVKLQQITIASLYITIEIKNAIPVWLCLPSLHRSEIFIERREKRIKKLHRSEMLVEHDAPTGAN